MSNASQSKAQPVPDAFDAAEDAHGAANPDPHIWAERHAAERYVIAFSHFEDCETRDGKTVETIVGKQRDGDWSREWLFPPENPDSRGWRFQEIEFIDGIRSKLKPGDILVFELGAERPSTKTPDRKVRPFKASYHPAAELPQSDNGVAGDEETEAALSDERATVDEAVGKLNAPLSDLESDS